MKYKIEEDEYSAEQLIELGRKSPDAFYHIFFPRTVRQPSADFHLEVDAALEDSTARVVLLEMFRDSAKTTRLRLFMARRIAYGLSKTIFFLGASEGHAARSCRWIRKQVEFNKVYSEVFGLRLGSKQNETELEVVSDITGETCWILGTGYTGSVRGINFDDYRPDLIVVDDVVTDENAATQEQREKVIELVDSAVRNSLAPEVDDPNAKMVVAQTPIARGDLTEEMKKDSRVRHLHIPIWTKETLDLPADQQESRWPQRWPTAAVREDKLAASKKNRLSLWIREKEVRLVSPEKRDFRPEWLKQIDIMPTHTRNILSIDPVPPPSEREVAKGLKGKDWEVLAVVGQYGEDYYVKDFEANRGHEPNWTVTKVFELADRHNVVKVVVEGINYQRTLKWILEQEMKRRGKYYHVDVVTGDKRSKYNRIVSTLAGIASSGHLYCRPQHLDFIGQFNDYSDVEHDDYLDAVAQGLSKLINPVLEKGAADYLATVDNPRKYRVPRLRGAP